jgi:hypothetical protein
MEKASLIQEICAASMTPLRKNEAMILFIRGNRNPATHKSAGNILNWA